MCGICGIYNFEYDNQVSSRLLNKMTDIMQHRGPDGRGIHIDGNLGLGHRRLSIIDLETGSQPMNSICGNIWIVFNGEIYNFKGLRDELVQRGYAFKTKSDTEVILNSYLEFGIKCIEKFNGMFSFALWDNSKRELILVRDRFGIKPLYYSYKEYFLVFASEIKSILIHPMIKKQVNKDALVEYFNLRYTLENKTLFYGISQVPPGSYMVISPNGIKTFKYWQLGIKRNHISFNEALEKVEHLFNDSVKKRMISDVPIGAFLSGGLDSSAIVSVMSENSSEVETISVGFNHEKYNELEYARLVAEKFGTRHHEFVLKVEDYLDIIEKLVWHRDSPLEVKNEIAIYFLAKTLKKHFTVALSGEGADELFAGYPKYIQFGKKRYLLKLLHSLPGFYSSKYYDGCSKIIGKGRGIKKILSSSENVNDIDNQLLISLIRLKDNEILKNELSDSIQKMEFYLKDFFSGATDLSIYEKYLYYDALHHLPSLLMRIDKMTMAASVETRVPFLDHRLFEFVFSLPFEFKTGKNNKNQKRLLKNIFSDKLPPQIISRKKMGFPVPVKEWMNNKLFFGIVNEIIFNNKSKIREYFDFEKINVNGNVKNIDEEIIWRLLNLEIWHNKFIDN